MSKKSLGLKAIFVCVGVLLGSLLGPVVKKKQPTSQELLCAQERISKNLSVIEQYMDQKYGKGFFKEQIQQHASRTEILNMLETQEGTDIYEDYVRTL